MQTHDIECGRINDRGVGAKHFHLRGGQAEHADTGIALQGEAGTGYGLILAITAVGHTKAELSTDDRGEFRGHGQGVEADTYVAQAAVAIGRASELSHDFTNRRDFLVLTVRHAVKKVFAADVRGDEWTKAERAQGQ